MTLWARFNDLTPTRTQIPWAINTQQQDNFVQGFAGMEGGYMFGSAAPQLVSTLPGDNATNWHHYAFTWDYTEANFYLDGALVSTLQQTEDINWWHEQAYIIVGCSGYNDRWLLDLPHNTNSDFGIDGELDDLGLYAKALTAAEVRAIATSSQADKQRGFAADPDLIIFWDFNDGPNGGVVPNRGTAGSDYDLLMGQLPKPLGITATSAIQDNRFGLTTLEAPSIIPGSVPKPITGYDTTAPLVLTAAAGETVTSTQHGTSFSFTAPTPFPSTHVAVDGGVTIHVVPKAAPTGAAAASNVHRGVEDRAINIQLWGKSSWAPGSALVPKITALPTGGVLYVVQDASATSVEQADRIVTAGQSVPSAARYVRYVPNPDGASSGPGVPYDRFSYSLVAPGGVEGPPTTKKILLASVNDLPEVSGSAHAFDEDAHPGGLAIPLVATDAETGTMLDLYIASLPAKGDLYLTADGTAEGKYGAPISREYSHFDVGGAVSSAGQRPTEVLAVSSFWGNPPNTGYHPLNMLGDQSCWSYGECNNEQPWVNDASLYPRPGTHVTHTAPGAASPLAARVVSVDEAARTTTVEYLKMYTLEDGSAPNGPEGVFVQCHIAPGSNMSYPADCLASNVPPSGVVVATVPRVEITTTKADNWSSRNKNYVGNVTMAGGGAFGKQYAYSHNQAEHYLTEGYTEYIELRIPEPMYVVMVEFGASRGMGAIVGVKAKTPGGEWVELYKGRALISEWNEYKSTGSYWKWAPAICRTHFLATDFRVEVDTSAETGIADWNEIDYMKVYGTHSLQPAVLPHGQGAIVYVPRPNAHGADAFTFAASDCTGNIFRSGQPQTISFDIRPVNDAPTTDGADGAVQRAWTDVHVPLAITLAAADADAADTLTYAITRPPRIATLTRSDGSGLPAEGWTSATPPVVIATATSAGEDDFEYSVSDGRVTTLGTISLQLVEIPADFAAADSGGAYAVYVILALAVLSKLGLLGYLVRHRRAPVFRDAQPVFCGITIMGGVMGDFTPLLLFGPVSDTRCHGFVAYLLLSVTLLYGPLVLKSYRIWKIFDNPTMKHVNLGVTKLLGVLLGYLLLELALIVATALAAPIRAAEFQWKAFPDYPAASRYRCDASGTPFDILAYALGGLPLLFALYLSAKTRNVKGQYSETKPILAALYTLICFGGVLQAIAYLVGGTNVLVVAYLSSFGILFISTISVFAFMLPKLWAFKYPKVVPEAYTMTGGGTMAGHGSSGTKDGSNNNNDDAADESEELAEAKRDMSEMREQLAELRQSNKELNQSNKELKAEVEAAGRVP